MRAALRVRGTDLRKVHGDGRAAVVALDCVEVEFGPGLTVVTGPSGSGKSTLLHCCAGLTGVDRGTITVGEVDLGDLGETGRADLRARHMGFVFQDHNLLPALTAAENVELPLVMAAADVGDVRDRARAALGAVGLADRADARPDQLSGGEQQRVAVARALVTDPNVVWADEPTGALDSDAAATVMDLLVAAAGEGRTVVVVSHDDRVVDAADVVVRLRDGRNVP